MQIGDKVEIDMQDDPQIHGEEGEVIDIKVYSWCTDVRVRLDSDGYECWLSKENVVLL